jgi:hypothetical protein
MTQRKTIVK